MTLLLLQMSIVLLVTVSCGWIALLNTRGLVELIVLKIAYNVGALTPTLFTMMVIMALVTTMLTAPMLNLLGIRDGPRTKNS